MLCLGQYRACFIDFNLPADTHADCKVLTCMSTMATLISKGTLQSVNMGLLGDELAERGLFGTQRLFRFLGEDLPKIPSQDSVLSTEEQTANLFGRFLTNRPFILRSPISPIRHLRDAIWEMKTLDVRLFGWFVERDCLVLDSGCDVKLLKSGKLNYSGFINQTSYVRKNLGFEAADYIQGTTPNDILTKFIIAPRR